MSGGQRVGLIAVALVAVFVAFVIAKPEDSGDKADMPAGDTTVREPSTSTTREPTATTDTRPEERIRLTDHSPAGGVRRIQVRKGDFVRLTVESDVSGQLHLHGYDIERKAGPGAPARFAFRARIEGIFELESHEAERGGGDPVIARLVVEPS
jgi:hypothetical protein